MNLELHISNVVVKGGDLCDLRKIAENTGGPYEIFLVFQSNFWKVPIEKIVKQQKFIKMTIEQIKEASRLHDEGKLLKEIAPLYNVSPTYLSKAICSIS